MTTYGYCANNPVSHIDPDGRIVPAFVIGAIIGAAINTTSQIIQNGGFRNFNWGNFGISTITGAVGGGIADALPNLLGQSAATSIGGNIAQGALNGAISGGISGGVGSALSGGNFWNGALGGFIAGGIGGGLGGLIEGNPLENALYNAPKLAMVGPKPKPKPKFYKDGSILLDEVKVQGFIEKGYDYVSGAIKETWGDAIRVSSTLASSFANNINMVMKEGVHEGSPYNRANAPFRPYELDLKKTSWIPERDNDYMGGVSSLREKKLYNSTLNLTVDAMSAVIPEYKFIPNLWVRWFTKWRTESYVGDTIKDNFKK
ncbi:MAG: hypothetical protein MUF58_02490 [Arcicella sp.]|jgi:hypothetical protein|nr:hypothetical protein [Arcicella sp.]